MRRRGVRKNAGYSLIEIVVVLALIAILTGVAALSLGDYLPTLRLKRASQELQLQIQKARLEAVRRSRDCHVEFHKVIGTDRYAPIIWVDENGNGTYEAGEEVFRQRVAAGTLELEDYGGIRLDVSKSGEDGVGDGVTFNDNAFYFNSRGICLSPADNKPTYGSIHLLNSKGLDKSIMVTLGGAVRINR